MSGETSIQLLETDLTQAAREKRSHQHVLDKHVKQEATERKSSHSEPEKQAMNRHRSKAEQTAETDKRALKHGTNGEYRPGIYIKQPRPGRNLMPLTPAA